MKNTSKKMPLELFEKIVAKVKSEDYAQIGLYSWNEPFLNLTLHEYVSIVKRAGLACEISSTLSLRRIAGLEKVLCAGLDHLTVSVSGADQATYERNHVGGNLRYVLENLQRVREIIDRNKLSTVARVRMIRFSYNNEAEEPLRAIADDLGLNFEIIEGGGDPDQKPSPILQLTPEWFDLENDRGSKRPLQESPSEVCSLLFDKLTIDCDGMVYLCCAFPNTESLKIGAYLNLGVDDLLMHRFRHPLCRVCSMPRRPIQDEDRSRLGKARQMSLVAAD